MSPLAQGNQVPNYRDTSIVSLVSALIEESCASHASDIHLDPTPDGTRVRVRIDGVLADQRMLPVQVHAEIIARIKILAALRTDEHYAAQDGRFRHRLLDGTDIDIRVSIMPTYHGENAVLRLLTEAHAHHTLPMLGFGKEEEERIRAALATPGGMILATGPTGSGKTTTLYTLIQMLHAPDVSIVTIEDPIEYAMAGVRQIQVNTRTGLLFAHGLRSLLRQDPDIIMVGEIRDTETAAMAVNTALTGHLVLSSLHTTNAATTLPRLLDMKIEPFLIASTIRLVIGQRLVRRICESCKEEGFMPETALKKLPKLAQAGETIWYRGRGCDACGGSGYRGRLSINEVLVPNERIRDAIIARASASALAKIAAQEGMTTMLEDGIRKAAAGETTIEEVLRAVQEQL